MDKQQVMADEVTHIAYSLSPTSAAKQNVISVNEKLSAAASETKLIESADKVTLASLLLLAKEKEAVKNGNYQIEDGWNKKTKEKAKGVVNRMMQLMDDREKEVLISGTIPDGEIYETWNSSFKNSAAAVQKKFLESLTARFDSLPQNYRDGAGLSQKGEPYFVGAANREAALTTAENKLKTEQEQKEEEQRKDEKKEKEQETRKNSFTRGKQDYN
jgi:hypothetical protein